MLAADTHHMRSCPYARRITGTTAATSVQQRELAVARILHFGRYIPTETVACGVRDGRRRSRGADRPGDAGRAWFSFDDSAFGVSFGQRLDVRVCEDLAFLVQRPRLRLWRTRWGGGHARGDGKAAAADDGGSRDSNGEWRRVIDAPPTLTLIDAPQP